ncbi:MAG: hypothetical protein Q9219_003332 [cf. Caloplaca sp. 3 TL-2023]
MFSILGLFKKTQCPEYPQCFLTDCLFAHDQSKQTQSENIALNKTSEAHPLDISNPEDGNDGPRKRRRLDVESGHDSESKGATKNTSAAVLSPVPGQADLGRPFRDHRATDQTMSSTALRPISPPPLRGAKDTFVKRAAINPSHPGEVRKAHEIKTVPSSLPVPKRVPGSQIAAPKESLNPRMLPNPPASHPIRMKLLTMLHEHMTHLNEQVRKSQDQSHNALALSDQELIIEVLDEEFQVAKKSPNIYQNVIKNRIMVLKKMKLEVWIEERTKKIAQKQLVDGQKLLSTPRDIETGLNRTEEIAFVPRLVASQEGLSKHGYITTIPTAAELEAAKKGVNSAHGWEQCDRCKTRFQVFPGRREEDGVLTSGGQCTYHWAKPRRPERLLGDSKIRDLMYPCCDETLGASTGCTKAKSHVFKISDPKRLALIMPFQPTPVTDRTDLPGAVCFDCEMGYTTYGMELIRLTATAWPDGQELLDVLVRPLGEVLDLNSRYSGVRPEEYANAALFEEKLQPGCSSTLRIVESPSKARELLFKLLSPETPLIGHALENDLNAARMLHPTIVDTCLLYPHPRGLPVRYGLKVLMKKHLGRDIQMGGEQGHDPKEDARAAGDLVRFRIRAMWQRMKSEGWTVQDGDFLPPLPRTAPNGTKSS